MRRAVVLAGIRTPIGRYGGSLSHVRPDDLAALVIREVVSRADVPPEQIEGGDIDGRADVYSLGCVLYECLAGVRPFDRDTELAVVFAHLNEPPPRLTELRPELPIILATGYAELSAPLPPHTRRLAKPFRPGELLECIAAALTDR